MSLINVKKLIGERVFVECENDRQFIGTLSRITELSFCLIEWTRVTEFDESRLAGFILNNEQSELYLCHTGMLREVCRIYKNLRLGDPHDLS